MSLTSNKNLPEELALWFTKYNDEMINAANAIFENPEIAHEEEQSCKILREFAENQGFRAESVKDIPTAFVAKYGSGRPVIGFLAEYDALPGLGQNPCPVQSTIEGAGHGCGHNLLGVGAASAAAALRNYMKKNKVEGTIILYGCPAEEVLSGKIIMNKLGLFNELDVAITWHPFDRNRISNDIWLAHDIKNYNFYGKSSHAAKFPELGRSSLDAAELMNVGVNYLREHVTSDVRMHYAYTSAAAPANIVSDFVQTNYFIRAASYQSKEDASKRVDDCAKGAAMMTGTTVDIEYVTGCKEMKVNRVLAEAFYDEMRKLETPSYSEFEIDFAEKISKEANLLNNGQYFSELEPLEKEPCILPIGTDVAEVSHEVPTVIISASTMCKGTALHHWATTAQSGMSIGYKGMIYAAKVMALGAVRLVCERDVIEKSWSEHNNK